ncbi:MAG: hypothetical protein K0S76_3025 [Herbinix sp.]|jgi:regulatory protein|nr:hypothetical protein [Herbinix sp.]
MIISSITETKDNKVKVFIDNEYAFWLYRKDLKRYQLEEGNDISDMVYHEILEDIVLYRAKQKALAILKYMDRTKYELNSKLKDAGYTDPIIELVMDYVTGYGYINDERFASSYVKNRMNTKSKMIIKMELIRKGIDKDLIGDAITSEYRIEDLNSSEDPELSAIKKAILKKGKDLVNLSYDEKQKLVGNLYRKGFDIDKIHKVIEEIEN